MDLIKQKVKHMGRKSKLIRDYKHGRKKPRDESLWSWGWGSGPWNPLIKKLKDGEVAQGDLHKRNNRE